MFNKVNALTATPAFVGLFVEHFIIIIIFIIIIFARAISIEDHFSNFGVPKLLHEYVII